MHLLLVAITVAAVLGAPTVPDRPFPSQTGSARTPVTAPGPPSRLRVSENGRHLVEGDGQPFFWLGDTAWLLFQKTTREEADLYLATRARQGFTVVQAAIVMGEE